MRVNCELSKTVGMDKRIPKALTQSMFFIPACPFRTHSAVGQIKHAYTTAEKSAVLTGAGRTNLLQISEKGKISMGYTGD